MWAHVYSCLHGEYGTVPSGVKIPTMLRAPPAPRRRARNAPSDAPRAHDPGGPARSIFGMVRAPVARSSARAAMALRLQGFRVAQHPRAHAQTFMRSTRSVPTPHPLGSALRLAMLAALALASACKVTTADLEHWKRTQLGPDKLAAVVASPRYTAELRSTALVALATMDRTDVQPVDAFKTTLARLVRANDPSFGAIVEAAVPQLESEMRGGERPTQAGQPPSDQQSNAKDAAFLLSQRATGAARTRLQRSVMGWFAADFAQRSGAGRHGIDEVTRAYGAPSAALLLPALDAKLDRDAMAKIANIVATVGDDATKRTAGERLIAIEREMEGAPFFEWVTGEVRRAMSVAGATPPEARIVGTATLTREGLLTGGAITGMKALARVPAVATRLLEIASAKPNTTTTPPPPPALIVLLQQRRAEALAALAEAVNASHVTALLAIALDAANPGNVREGAFDRLADTHSTAAIAPLWPVVGNPATAGDAAAQREARTLRARAAELVLQVGGAASLADLYAHLPQDPATIFEPAELEGYAGRLASMTPPPSAAVRRDLTSSVWWRRVIAIHFVAKSGDASDVATLTRLSSDAMPTVGSAWASRTPPMNTVGKVAGVALESLRERLALPPAH